VGFLWLGPIDSGVDEISSKNEREREESRARINRDRSSQEDRERERARLKERRREGNETIPNNALNQSEQEPKKGREIPKKIDSEG